MSQFQHIIDLFQDVQFGNERGIGTWLTAQGKPEVLDRLGQIEQIR